MKTPTLAKNYRKIDIEPLPQKAEKAEFVSDIFWMIVATKPFNS